MSAPAAIPQPLHRRAAAALAAAALALAPLAGPLANPPPAAAVLNSPNAQIARSADVALRRAIPGNNGYMRSVQVKTIVATMNAVDECGVLVVAALRLLVVKPTAGVSRCSAKRRLRFTTELQGSHGILWEDTRPYLLVQAKLESIQFKLRIPQRKPWGAISDDATNAAITMAQFDKVTPSTAQFWDKLSFRYSAGRLAKEEEAQKLATDGQPRSEQHP